MAESPIVVGLAGPAGSGKTSAADILAPMAQNQALAGSSSMEEIELRLFPSHAIWDHRTFSLPITRMYTAKTEIEGDMSQDRIRYFIHNELNNLFSSSPLFGAPTYPTLIAMVEEIANMRLSSGDSKPRAFYQDITDMCKSVDPRCFAKRAMQEMTQKFIDEKNGFLRHNEDLDDFMYACIFSDLRMDEERLMIDKQPGGITVFLNASDETRADRIMNRDGSVDMKALRHHSETIDPNQFDYVIETDNLSPIEVALEVRDLVMEKAGHTNAYNI